LAGLPFWNESWIQAALGPGCNLFILLGWAGSGEY
jgi:hypothetical protein